MLDGIKRAGTVGWVRSPICDRNPTTSCATRKMLGYVPIGALTQPTSIAHMICEAIDG